MKLKAHEVGAFLRAPDTGRAGILIYGTDPMRIADGRAAAALAIGGPDADRDMRLTRMAGADLRKDPATLIDEIKARGFFDGPRVVVIEDATDTLTPTIKSALDAWETGDATLIVTAGSLTARAKLRKLFEDSANAVAAPIYDAPMTRDEIAQALRDAGLTDVPRDAQDALTHVAQMLEPGDFRQTLEKLVLYKRGDAAPLSAADIDACAPKSAEADLDVFFDIVAEGRSAEIGPTLDRLYAQGVTPVSLCIGAMRHFRTLHRAASDPGGASAGAARLRPPVFGPRRDRLVRQANRWGTLRLERALDTLLDTDLTLRSAAQTAPAHALVERALIRLAMLAGG